MTPIPAEADPLLAPWLAAPAGPLADQALARLLEEGAAPVLESILRRKFGGAHAGPDAEDVASETRLQVIARLQRLRAPACPGDPLPPPRDFRAYVATVTYQVWAEHLRRRHPARAMLLNRVRYLLEGRAGSPRGFALWRGASGEWLGGFAAWRDAGRLAQPTPREHWLLVDAPAAAAAAFGGSGAVPADLPALLAGLLSWLDGPLELRGLVRALGTLLGVIPAAERSLDTLEGEDAVPPDAAPSPLDCLRWKESLGWLWREAGALPLRQRTAFLLHGNALREMEALGLTSVRAAATVLELAPERLAELWSRLPLDDLQIAALLGGSRQQVINLRKVARATLGKSLARWREE